MNDKKDMIMQVADFLQLYANLLVEKNKSINSPGLWDGKTGTAITLFHLSRIIQKKEYETEANGLIDEVYSAISGSIPYHFSDGLLGIGCGLAYIMDNGFMEGDSDEILPEIDQMAMNIIDFRPVDLHSLGIGKGVCGVGCYLYYRLRHKPENDERMITLKLKEHIIYLVDWMEELLKKTEEKTDYTDSYFLLCRFLKLDVFNNKVEKLAATCLQKMIESNYIVDNYELLGIPTLKALKPWI